MTTLIPAAKGYEVSKILNGPYVALVMFVIVAFLFAMTVWNCIYFNRIRTHVVSDTQTAKRPISKREATTLLVVNVVMSLLLAFIAGFFLWKVFMEESVRAHFIKVGDTVGVYSGKVTEAMKKKFRGSSSAATAYDRPPVILDGPEVNGASAPAADLGGLFEQDPEALFRTQREGFFKTEDGLKQFRCFRRYGSEDVVGGGGSGDISLPARFRPSASSLVVSPPPPSIQPPRLPQVSRVLDTRVNIDVQPLSSL